MLIGGAKRREQKIDSNTIGVPVISVFMGVVVMIIPTIMYKSLEVWGKKKKKIEF